MKTKLFLFFMMLNLSLASAQNFTANAINYTVTSTTAPLTVEVAVNSSYTGVLNIPATATDPTTSITYSITSIGNYAFYNCIGITSLTIPNSVTSIGDYAFGLVSGITTLTIPNSVTSIGIRAFSNCSGITSLIIPNSVTTIGNNAFFACTGITSLTIGNSVTSIGDGAFQQCSAVTSVAIPNSVTTMGAAFSGCSALTSVTIGNSVTSIGPGTFFLCSALTSVTIGNSVTSIGDSAFYFCSSLTSITCATNTPILVAPNAFTGVNLPTCCLIVPASSVSAYQAAPIWQNFSFTCGTLATNNFMINNFELYPNPTKNSLNIKLDNFTSKEEMSIVDVSGKLIYTQKIEGLVTTVNTTDFSKGIYFVNLNSSEGTITKKIIKN